MDVVKAFTIRPVHIFILTLLFELALLVILRPCHPENVKNPLEGEPAVVRPGLA